MALMLDERGLLPPGVHDATLDEIEAAFGNGERRAALMRNLREYVELVRQFLPAVAVIVDGSFVMAAVEQPGDLDVILELPPGWDERSTLRTEQYGLVDEFNARQEFQVAVISAVVGTDSHAGWIDWFCLVRGRWIERFGWFAGIKKGIVRVTP